MTSKGLHPFFASARNQTSALQADSAPSKPQSATDSPAPTEREPTEVDHNGPTLMPTTPPPQHNDTTDGSKSSSARKRRKLNQDHPSVGGQPQAPECDRFTLQDKPSSANVSQPKGLGVDGPSDLHVNTYSSPTNQPLELNGKGGFSTPRKSRTRAGTIRQPAASEINKKRKPRKSRGSLVVIVPYGDSDDSERRRIGEAISGILASPISDADGNPTQVSSPQAPPMHAQAVNPSKRTHPFFSAKPQANDLKLGENRNNASMPVDDESTRRVRSFTTPVKKLAPFPSSYSIRDGPPSTLGLNPAAPNKSLQHGLKEPLWPPRTLMYRPEFEATNSTPFRSPLRPRSRKQKPAAVAQGESVLDSLVEVVAARRRGAYNHLMPDFQLFESPTRSIESGSSFRRRVFLKLGEISQPLGVTLESRHPALDRNIALIGQELSAFDCGACDTQVWTQKYEPRTAECILQAARDTTILRNWLINLAVDHVESGLQTGSDSHHRGPVNRKKKRRKTKIGELDDFIVGSDDEGELTILTDPEEAGATAQSASVLREALSTGSRDKNYNAMLISGPHGCGKTAAVHAIAKELHYEVFEINSTSRRSGREVIERVGNMALNHQVRRRKTDTGEEDLPLVETFPSQKSNLNSFFSSKPVPRSVGTTDQKRQLPKDAKEKKQPKRQTQALILLEEVDVLFDDDKQFWDTVIDLARQSRRPIIMTCRDEGSLPLDELSVQAILRFRKPSPDLAVAYLLTMAAAEGHFLSIDALQSLYMSKQMDLRASIMELQYRCQKSVGDDKGGMSWQISRWPPGRDLDEAGEVKHVVSNSTFMRGMGLRCSYASGKPAESLAIESWHEHYLDPLNLAHDFYSQHIDTDAIHSRAWFDLSLHLSDADCFSAIGLPRQRTPESDVLDPTLPPLQDQDGHDYTSLHQLLQADPIPDYTQTSTSLRTATAISALSLLTDKDSLKSYLEDKSLAILENPKPTAQSRKAEQGHQTATALEPLLDDDSNLLRPALHTDIAPYTRSIAGYDLALDAHRAALSAVEGGKSANKLRKTRAARSAMEGGQRAITRRDRWFDEHVDCAAIMATAGKGWPRREAEMLAAQGRAVAEESAVDTGMETMHEDEDGKAEASDIATSSR